MLPTYCINPTFAACTNGLCVHKAVFPATGLEIGGVIILPLLLGFANNGGIGGGGLIIPVCIFMFGFNTIQAIAISNSTIFVGAAVRYFGFSLFAKHPQKNATIIDYNLCAVMLPLVLVGSFVGVMISNILPEGILTIILVIVLFYLTYDSFEKAIGLWKKETVAMEKEALAYKPLPGNSTELANIQSTTLSNNSGDLLGPKQSLNRDSA